MVSLFRGDDMSFAEKLKQLRSERGYSQENLAEMLGVSRQAVSKWESGRVYPDIDYIVEISNIFNVSTDYLLKDTETKSHDKDISQNQEQEKENSKDIYIHIPYRASYEYKSKTKIGKLPLVHVNVGRGKRVAKGVIAIGNISVGVISLGVISCGIISFGVLALGLLCIAVASLGLISIGAIAFGGLAIGGIAIGYLATGGVAVGIYAVGGVAIAKDIAIGWDATANVAVGKVVHGAHTIIDTADSDSFPSSLIHREDVRKLIYEVYPNIRKSIVDWLTFPFR